MTRIEIVYADGDDDGDDLVMHLVDLHLLDFGPSQINVYCAFRKLLQLVEHELVVGQFQYYEDDVEEDADEHHEGTVVAAALSNWVHIYLYYILDIIYH